MRHEPVPIEFYIPTLFQTQPKIVSLIQPWRIEPSQLHDIVIKSFREMGIFVVNPALGPIMTEATLAQLKYSPEVKVLLDKAERLEKSRSKHRTTD